MEGGGERETYRRTRPIVAPSTTPWLSNDPSPSICRPPTTRRCSSIGTPVRSATANRRAGRVEASVGRGCGDISSRPEAGRGPSGGERAAYPSRGCVLGGRGQRDAWWIKAVERGATPQGGGRQLAALRQGYRDARAEPRPQESRKDLEVGSQGEEESNSRGAVAIGEVRLSPGRASEWSALSGETGEWRWASWSLREGRSCER